MSNLTRDFTIGDEISFIVKEYNKVSPEGFTTGYSVSYLCSVKPCK